LLAAVTDFDASRSASSSSREINTVGLRASRRAGFWDTFYPVLSAQWLNIRLKSAYVYVYGDASLRQNLSSTTHYNRHLLINHQAVFETLMLIIISLHYIIVLR